MSRRGGKRRQVLQLGESSSKLHRYGYAKGFQSKDNSVQGLPLTLVGDYSDSDTEDTGDQSIRNPTYGEESQDGTPPVEQETASVNGGDGEAQSKMDDELRNFLSEIEAIPMPDETKTPDSISNDPSPTPHQVQEEPCGVDNETDIAESAVPKKKTGAYSMFVKGEVEFAHSPVPAETDESQEETKEKAVVDKEILDIPEEPTTLWQMVQDEATQYYYYWNWRTNEVTWEIPSDYTQYLLLHKEYEEKMAKYTPQQIQAHKDKKASKEVKVSSNGSSTTAKNISPVDRHTDDTTKSEAEAGPESRTRKELEDRSHSHHHKKKKNKKHKRRHDESDEDIDGQAMESEHLKPQDMSGVEKAALEPSSSVRKSEKSKPIGPQALSIVPYMSDNDDEEEEETVVGKHQDAAVLSNKEDESTSSPAPLPSIEATDSKVDSPGSDVLASCDVMMQELVEFADSVTVPNLMKDGQVSTSKEQEEIEINATTNKQEALNSFDSKSETFLTKESVCDGIALEDEQVVKAEQKCKGTEETHSEKKLVETFTLRKEKKIKKETINMFADESPPRNDDKEETELGMESQLPKMDIEEGELSDSLDALAKPSVEPLNKDLQKGGKKTVPSNLAVKDKSELSSKELFPLFKGIVGYSEEDEEEEGELKEEPLLEMRKKEEVKSVELKRNERHREGKDSKKLGKEKHMKGAKSREISEKIQNITKGSSINISTTQHDRSGSRKSEEREVLGNSAVEGGVQAEGKSVKNMEKDDDDDTEDIDFDDLDDIDRVLEMALEKKREQKTVSTTVESKSEADKKTKDNQEISTSSTAENKTSETDTSNKVKTSKDDESQVDDTDKEALTSTIKDSAELALSKLRFLDISTKNLSKLQVLLIELKTRYTDWQAGGLNTWYFHKQLETSDALLCQYEESAVPSGWLCQWDRASGRYFYQNRRTNHTQWEYPTEADGDVKGKSEDKDGGRKKRRSKDEEREEVAKTRGSSSSRSSRHRSKKTQEKDRSKRDRHSSSAHHHRKKKRRRRDHSSESSSSEDESTQSRHRHKSKRKKRGKSDKSPSVELVGEMDGVQNAQLIEDSPPPPSLSMNSDPSALGSLDRGDSEGRSDPVANQDPPPPQPPSSSSSHLVADYGSDQDMEKEDENRVDNKDAMETVGQQVLNFDGSGDMSVMDGGGVGDEPSVDGEAMEKDGVEEEEDVNTAVIIRPPQIIVPPYVAAMNQPQMYTAPSIYPPASIASSATLTAPPASQEKDVDVDASQTLDDADKGAKKKKKDKSGKEKSLSANSSIMMKKKRVSSMVQKWQQVKKEVEKEDRAKELRQAAIREKINQLK